MAHGAGRRDPSQGIHRTPRTLLEQRSRPGNPRQLDGLSCQVRQGVSDGIPPRAGRTGGKAAQTGGITTQVSRWTPEWLRPSAHSRPLQSKHYETQSMGKITGFMEYQRLSEAA